MKKYRIGVLCPSEIAFRRFMPALKLIDSCEYVGIAVANEMEWFGSISPDHNLAILDGEREKAERFKELYGGKIFNSYEEILTSNEVDVIYIPLPPALHYKWAKKGLECGKHVFVEKPSTTSYNDTKELVEIAKKNNLVFRENYMFVFHNQIQYVQDVINKKELGDIRLIRVSFGFPFRGANDFRYNKKLGGGALLDCGGYTLKLASILLGDSVSLVNHQLGYRPDYEVDIYGSGTLKSDKGLVAQVSFGMDNSYKCELEVWGSEGTLFTDRILTAPFDFRPTMHIKTKNGDTSNVLEPDDCFKKSICNYIQCIENIELRNKEFNDLLTQARLVEEFKEDNK